jgi:hypothetical protein
MCNFLTLMPTPLQPITLVTNLADELLLTSANEVSEQYNILQIYKIDRMIQCYCYEDIVSSSLPCTFIKCTLEGEELMVELEAVEGESTLGELTSCHAGIVGLPR